MKVSFGLLPTANKEVTKHTRPPLQGHLVEVVVEVDVPSAEVPAEEGGVGDEHRGHVEVPGPAEDEPYASQPLVKLGYDERGPLFGIYRLSKLHHGEKKGTLSLQNGWEGGGN